MRMQPRQELLDIWRAVIRASWLSDQNEWQWRGEFEPNSIADAEQLLCLLIPAVLVEAFGLDEPDRTNFQMLNALADLGGATEIPRRLINIMTAYFERYAVDGVPIFSGDSYFANSDGDPTSEQRELDIVDSFAMSITLSLATIGFVRVFRKTTKRLDVQRSADTLEQLASTRLSAAMVGLLRSFTVNVFDTGSQQGLNLLQTVNQEGLGARHVVPRLQEALRQTAASFREVLIGSGQVSDLDSPDRLFECGWSWGIIDGAPIVDTTEDIGDQRIGIAEPAPYLYFTVIAMDAIEDLFSERTRILGLLNEDQQRLARALQLRSDLTRTYWATVATFSVGGGRWPLEDIPWRTTDGLESEYFTLQVTSLAVKGLTNRRGSDADLMRIGKILDELANRARVTRKPLANDVAMRLHVPGVQVTLNGSESAGQARLVWNVLEFAPLLMHRMVGIAGLLSNGEQRGVMLDMADHVWEHLIRRRLGSAEAKDLWDRPAGAFPGLLPDHGDLPSWYYTERVVQALATAANVLDRPPLPSDRLLAVATDLVTEADQIFDAELMRDSAGTDSPLGKQIKQIEASLRRARELLNERPGTAAALSSNVLVMLDELAAGRQNASETV